jgi:5-methylcytosine-specific restriction endonuclease McrA
MRATAHRLFMKRTSNAFHSHKKRAREAGVELDYTLDQLRDVVKEALGDVCQYCGGPLTVMNWETDHRLPTSRGGQHALANIVIVCDGCNLAKGPISHDEFDALLDLLRTFHPLAKKNLLARLRAGGKVVRAV